MELSAGTRLGPYEIVDYIGAGAMGVVYRARDTRLGRDVAIKVLPPVFARDPDRLERFEREARAVAALNHPNIVSVHDIGTADVANAEPGQSATRVTYLVTELLDGDTLRARLAQGPLSARKSADVAMQVARGLAAAHDRGIVHRDLKPENLVLLRDGHVKILDFGLAKQTLASAGAGDQQTMAATEAGTVLGTVGYMAPEQVRGEAADPRSDLFALGAVLFELATGQRAFARATAAETMTAILREEPPEPALASLPPNFARIVRHALEKDANDRFQSARDCAFALQAYVDAMSSGTESAPVTPSSLAVTRRPMRRRELIAWVLASGLAITAGAVRWWPRANASATGSPVIFAPSLPLRDPALSSPAVAPDGTRVAFIARGRSGDTIVVRRFDAMTLQTLKGTAGARLGSLFWSTDGQSIGFCAGGKLKTIELATEKLEEIADAPSSYGAAWGPDGTILFSPNERGPILRVNVKGGAATPVTTLEQTRNEEAHRWPQFLPDGKHFVFMPWTVGATTRTIRMGSLDGGETKPLFESESAAVVAGNALIYVHDRPSRLMAQPFNPRTFELEGRPAAIVTDDNVSFFWASGDPMLSASASMLIYTSGKARQTQLTWFSRTGRPVGVVGDPDVHYDPLLSRDGNTLAVEKRDPDNDGTDIWTVDLARGAFSRLTSSPGFESVATWSPDGRRIAFASDQSAGPKIWVKNASGTGAEDALINGRAFPMDWSPDGHYLLYETDGGATRFDIWMYDTERRASAVVLSTPFNEFRPRFSPDGKWIAYVSDDAHDPQVYLRSFPDGAKKIQVSTAGGDVPEWRRDGRELFYLAPDSTLMAVDLRANGATFVVGTPQPLFLTNTDPPDVLRNTYTAALDGQRFLVMTPIVPPSASPLVGVLNWAARLTRKP